MFTIIGNHIYDTTATEESEQTLQEVTCTKKLKVILRYYNLGNRYQRYL